MALSGTQNNLSSAMLNDIVSKIQEITKVKIEDTNTLGAITQAISETIVAHIVANTLLLINSGIPVQVTVNIPVDGSGNFDQHGLFVFPIVSTGTTTSTGSGTVQ